MTVRIRVIPCLDVAEGRVVKGVNFVDLKDAGDPVCSHTMYGETEEELLQNAKDHGIKVHGYTEEQWNEEISKNLEHFRKIIKKT